MENPKTRQQFISAAKTLFVKKGYDETTMIDIADEAGLSRRTLYSYFESKVDVFQAVINSEVEKVLSQLAEIANQNLPVQQKIVEFVFGYFKLIKDMVDRNGTLRSGFFRNAWGLEHFRKGFDVKQKQMLQDIISEGKVNGLFCVSDFIFSGDINTEGVEGEGLVVFVEGPCESTGLDAYLGEIFVDFGFCGAGHSRTGEVCKDITL